MSSKYENHLLHITITSINNIEANDLYLCQVTVDGKYKNVKKTKIIQSNTNNNIDFNEQLKSWYLSGDENELHFELIHSESDKKCGLLRTSLTDLYGYAGQELELPLTLDNKTVGSIKFKADFKKEFNPNKAIVSNEEVNVEDLINSKEKTISELRHNPVFPNELPNQFSKLHFASGFPGTKRFNMHYLSDTYILFASGNSFQILDVRSKNVVSKTIKFGYDTDGIGVVVVHPSRKIFAACECGENPNILIYTYPGLQVIRILKNGSKRSYESAVFSKTGDLLATVGGSPDYLLTLWNWQEERIILRTKAFSQDVYRVAFSPRDQGRLITSGSGHIRFWKMASTFTGLKLQGDLGKFGEIDLTDIMGFVELPCGRVLSGSERGDLLMWNGNFIEFVLCREDDTSCHQGNIECIYYEDETRTIITGGADGKLCVWEYSELEFAELEDDRRRFHMNPIKEINLGDNFQIRGMIRGNDHFIIQSSNSKLIKLDVSSFNQTLLFDYHAGSINGVCVNNNSYIAITCGDDGSIRSWNVLNRQYQTTRYFNQPATCITAFPVLADSTNSLISVGFDDGLLRILKRSRDGLRIEKIFKPHGERINDIVFSPDGQIMSTISNDGTVFLFYINVDEFIPLGFIKIPTASSNTIPKSMKWSIDSKHLVVVCGIYVFVYDRPDDFSVPDESERSTFEINIPFKCFMIAIPYINSLYGNNEESNETKLNNDNNDTNNDNETNQSSKNKNNENEKKDNDLTSEATISVTEIPNPETLSVGALIFDETNNDSFICSVIVDNNDNLLKEEFIYYFNLNKSTISMSEPNRPLLNDDWCTGYHVISPIKLYHVGSGFGYINRLWYSSKNQFLILATSKGHVQCRPSWSLHHKLLLHGHNKFDDITNIDICTTSDDRFLMSVGNDSNFFVYNLNVHKAHEWAKEEVELYEFLYPNTKKSRKSLLKPKLAKSLVYNDNNIINVPQSIIMTALQLPELNEPEHLEIIEDDKVEDIKTSKYYSIEERKQKLEQDEQKAAAEKVKAERRRKIDVLRERFRQLMNDNEQLPENERLPPSSFELDPELRKQLEKETQKQISAVEEELAVETEQTKNALDKIRKYYLDDILVEYIELKAFDDNVIVSSFRTAELPKWLQDAVEDVHQAIREEMKDVELANMKNSTVGDNNNNNNELNVFNNEFIDENQSNIIATTNDRNARSAVRSANSDAEQRQKAREERRKLREQLEQAKPNSDADDPNDLKAINEASNNLGDYKLKSDPNYIVPENQQVNAKTKRREILLLQESIHFIKMGYNERFLALRELKKRIIENVKKDNDRIKIINHLLGRNIMDDIQHLEIDLKEWPESRDQYTDQDIEEFIVNEKLEKERKLNENINRGNFFLSSNSKNKTKNDINNKKNANININNNNNDSNNNLNKTSKDGKEYLYTYDNKKIELPKSLKLDEANLTQLERIQMLRSCRYLEHERVSLLSKIKQTIKTFDKALYDLRREKLRLNVDLKTTDLKLLRLYKEYQVLKGFSDEEVSLLSKLEHVKQLKQTVLNDMSNCEQELAHRLSEIEMWQSRDKEVHQEFTNVVGGPDAEFYAPLLKIFKKKVKQKKKSGQNGDDSDSDLGDLSDDYLSDGYSTDGDQDDDSCPYGCDSTVYEKVLALREKRIEQEQMLKEFENVVVDLNKRYQQHQLREQTIDKDLKQLKSEISKFQSTKQQALNAIEVTIPLKLSQITYLENDSLPEDISDGLIFNSSNLNNLYARISELQQNQIHLRNEFRDLKKHHKYLLKELKQKQIAIQQEKKKCEDVQILKFGTTIDINILDKVGAETSADELRRKFKRLESSSTKQIEQWNDKIQEAKDELVEVTQENTLWLRKVAELTKIQHQLEEELNATTQSIHASDAGPMEIKEQKERQKLVKLIRQQEQEIESLKAEIMALSHKSGTIYTTNSNRAY